MYRKIWIKANSYEFLTKALIEISRTLIAAGIALIIFLQFFHDTNSIAVVDLKKVVNEEKQRIGNKKAEEAAGDVGIFFSHLSYVIQNRKEIIVVKEAVLNPERVRDITDEVIQIARRNANISTESTRNTERQN